MANLSELWESARFSLKQGEYQQAIATLSERQSFIRGEINQTKIFWSHIHVQKTSGYDLFKVIGNLDGLIWLLTDHFQNPLNLGDSFDW